jgi:hypothetical protein
MKRTVQIDRKETGCDGVEWFDLAEDRFYCMELLSN